MSNSNSLPQRLQARIFGKARELYAAGWDDEALMELRNVVRVKPMNAEAYLLTGRIYMQSAVQIDPNNPEAIALQRQITTGIGSLMHLAATESIGLTTKTGAELRRMRGSHPRSVVTWAMSLDPAKHYRFVVTYENGRKAPNFEYLNKITTGLKVLY